MQNKTMILLIVLQTIVLSFAAFILSSQLEVILEKMYHREQTAKVIWHKIDEHLEKMHTK